MNSASVAKTHESSRGERGQTLVEYVLILALISLATIAALGFLSGKIQTVFSKSGNSLNSISVSSGPGSPPPPPPPAPPANGTVITNANSPGSTNAVFGTFYNSGGTQVCSTGLLACLFNAGATWTPVTQPGLYFPVPGFLYSNGQPCAFTWAATGYTFSGTWQGSPPWWRVGGSGGTDYGAACL